MAMTLRLEPEDERAAAALQQEWGVSKQEAIKRALRETAERHGHSVHVAAAADAMQKRWGAVIDELGRR